MSDTHGVLDARVLQVVSACDLCVHAGDIGTARVMDELRACCPLVCVRGNNDTPAKWPQSDRDCLTHLPTNAALELPGGELVLVHGHRHGPPARRHQRLRGSYPAARVVVYGHSHRLVIDTRQQPWVINPGAAGRARTYGGPSCVVLHAANDAWAAEAHRFPFVPTRRR